MATSEQPVVYRCEDCGFTSASAADFPRSAVDRARECPQCASARLSGFTGAFQERVARARAERRSRG